MDLHRETELGKITIAEKALAEVFLSILSEEEFEDRIWAATKRGRIIQKTSTFAESEIASIMEIKRGDEGRIAVSFSAVTRFGVSISAVTKALADRIAELALKHDKSYPKRVIIEVVGVKDKTTLKKTQDMIKEYEY